MEERGTVVVAAVLTAGTIAVAALAGMRALKGEAAVAQKPGRAVADERREPTSPALPPLERGEGEARGHEVTSNANANAAKSSATPTATDPHTTAPPPPALFDDERPPPGPPPPRAEPHHAS